MNTNWLLRLVQYARESFAGRRSTDLYFDTDADGRRMRSDLDAIRSRFPDHA
ncbi:hypothetical protein BH09ACT8_BH09ACT8_43860 [soil metagenome]